MVVFNNNIVVVAGATILEIAIPWIFPIRALTFSRLSLQPLPNNQPLIQAEHNAVQGATRHLWLQETHRLQCLISTLLA